MYNNANNKDSFSATTSLVSFFDRNGFQLRLSGMDTGLAIAIWSPVIDPVSGRKSYPKEKRYSIMLTIDRVKTLDIALEELLEAYKKGEDHSVGVFANNARDKILEVSVRSGDFYISLHFGIDAATLIPRETIEFKFEKTNIITGYDKSTGHMTITDIDGYYYLFSKLIMDYVSMGGSGMPGHAFRNTNKPTTDKMFKYLEQIAQKVGVTMEPSYGGGYSNQQSYGSGNYNSPQKTNEPSPSYTEVNSLEGLL